MIRLFILALVTSPICSKPGHFSSVMYGEKPILRMGTDTEYDDEETEQPEEPKEPEWVTKLRSNIQDKIKEVGHGGDAGPAVRKLIKEANAKVNGGSASESVEASPAPKSWQDELKSYIREVVNLYGSTKTNTYIRPVLQAVERAQQVTIKDIDARVPVSDHRQYQREGRDTRYDDEYEETRYTIGPDLY